MNTRANKMKDAISYSHDTQDMMSGKMRGKEKQLKKDPVIVEDKSSDVSNDSKSMSSKDNENVSDQFEESNEYLMQSIDEVIMENYESKFNLKWERMNQMMANLMTEQKQFAIYLRNKKNKDDTMDSSWTQKDREQYPFLNAQTGPNNC